MSGYDDYFTNEDKPFAENFNDALLLSNVFDLTVPIELPKMFSDSTWVNTVNERKAGVAIVTLDELMSGITIGTDSEDKSILTATENTSFGFYFYPNFNAFGGIKSIDWEGTGNITVDLYTNNNVLIIENISKGIIQNPGPQLRKLEPLIIVINMSSGSVLNNFQIVMKTKEKERYGATVGITDVTGLDDQMNTINSRLSSVENENTAQDSLINAKLDKDDLLDLVYPVGAIYMSVNSTNPGTLFGGTWERLKDRFLLAAGDTFSNGSTGGSKDAVVVSHNHTQNAHNHTPPADFMLFLTANGNVMINGWNRNFPATGGNAYFVYTDNAGADSIIEYRNTSNAQPTINYSGVSGTDKNMPPYLAVYMWKRTA